ncbi:hypothetical protein HDE_04828 [Halotydeus destructor]|nr:hypothetical protein HDE_04828 [Halotydeus destructor]
MDDKDNTDPNDQPGEPGEPGKTGEPEEEDQGPPYTLPTMAMAPQNVDLRADDPDYKCAPHGQAGQSGGPVNCRDYFKQTPDLPETVYSVNASQQQHP